MTKSYHELILLPTFKERFEYLKLSGIVSDPTFGGHRYLNQLLYRSPIWRSIRSKVIVRDNACDLGDPLYDLGSNRAYIHHINPITIEDIKNGSSIVFDLDNLITCSMQTHNAIHYGSEDGLPKLPVERTPNDTCPWK